MTTPNRYIVTVLVCLASLLISTSSGDVLAVPPSQIRGIDLSAVVAMYDRSRQTEEIVKGQVASSPPLTSIRTIVLDPGHGGGNQGAIGVAEIHEKYLTLELAYALRDRLQRQYPDVRVVMTRYWDQEVGLSERIEYANAIEADLFLSLHYNAAPHARAVGHETYFLVTSQAIPGREEKKGAPIATAALGVTGFKKDFSNEPQSGVYNDTMSKIQRDLDRQRQHKDSALLAKTVNASIATKVDSVNRGVKQANFAVLRGALMPAIVVESGFVTHPDEGDTLTTDVHRTQIVNALIQSIVRFDASIAERD